MLLGVLISRYISACTYYIGLLHGDFNFPNLVFDKYSTSDIKAVLDFEMASFGDVTSDVAEFIFCLYKPKFLEHLQKGKELTAGTYIYTIYVHIHI